MARKRIRTLLILLVLLAQWALGQQPASPPQPATPQTPPVRITPGTGDANSPPKARIEITVQAPEQPKASGQTQSEKRMSQAEADELFRSVDEMLKWVSAETGLPIKTPVKRELASRQKVESYVRDKMETDEDAKRIERSVIVLKKFGLVPREFDLGSFMVKLLGEQVVGYYDPKTKTVYLLDWVPLETQKPVLAHELTHALQDQNYDLDKWMHAGGSGSLPEDGSFPADPKAEQRLLQREVDKDEMESARQAVSEGQGMAVLIDYSLEPLGKHIVDSPELVDMMKKSMSSSDDSPVFGRAPLFLREVLTFPYKYGLGFEQALLMKGGKKAAFADALEHPPTTTRDIMEPDAYLKHETMPALQVPPIGNLAGANWERLDVGAMGEFDVYLLLDQYANAATAARLSKEWRGGYYYAALKKGAEKPNKSLNTSAVAIFYVSRWSSEAAARDFAAAYATSFLTRYRDVWPKKKDGGVDVQWDTNEGPMMVQRVGDVVVVSETFDAKTATRLRDAALEGVH